MLAFRAKYVFPIDGPPIAGGLVAIDHDRIVAVGPSNSPALADLLPAARDLGDVAILPGLINAHTHLEFSDLREPLGTSGMPLTDWIRLLVAHRRERLLSEHAGEPRSIEMRFFDPVMNGIGQLSWSGVTAVGEIESGANRSFGRSGAQYSTLNKSLPMEVTNFLEIISLKSSLATEFAGVLSQIFEQCRQVLRSDVDLGVSPHAPYTVHPDLLKKCARLSSERRILIAHHLAESREELMLLRTGSGPFVSLLEEFEAWDPDAIPFASRPLDYLRTLSEAHRALVIHGNYLDDEEIEFLAAHSDNMSVVYCPRTHDYFKHDPYPLAKMLAAGVNVALGTDSRASNPDLSILAELRFAAAKHPLVPPQRLLRMITADAARALGREQEIGTLTPGKFADLAILAVPSHKVADPYELLLDPATRVVTTIFRGHAVFGEKLLFL